MTTQFLVNYNIGSQFQISFEVRLFLGRVQNAARQDLIKYLYFITVIYVAQYILSHGFVWIQGIFSFQTARLGKLCTSTEQVENSQ